MEKDLTFGATGCVIATIAALLLIRYNPNPILPVILPVLGLVLGVAIARVAKKKK